MHTTIHCLPFENSSSLTVCNEILDKEKEKKESIFKNETFTQAFINIGKEQSSIQQRLELLKKIAKYGGDDLTGDLIGRIVEFDTMHGATIDQRLQLYNALITQGKKTENALASNFKSLGLQEATYEQILNLCRESVIRGSHAKDYGELITIIKNLGLSAERTFDLCNKMTGESLEVAAVLINNFEQFGLKKESMLTFSILIAQRGQEFAELVLNSFDKLNFTTIPQEKRFHLYKVLATFAPLALLNKLESGELGTVTLKEHIEICNILIKNRKELITYDSEEKSFPDKIIKECFKLCKIIMAGKVSIDKSENEDNLIHEFLYQEVEELSDELKRRGVQGVELIRIFTHFRAVSQILHRLMVKKFSYRDDDSYYDREHALKLCHEVVQSSPSTASDLIRDFDLLRLELSPKERIELATMIASQGPENAKLVLEKFKKMFLTVENNYFPISRVPLFEMIAKQAPLALLQKLQEGALGQISLMEIPKIFQLISITPPDQKAKIALLNQLYEKHLAMCKEEASPRGLYFYELLTNFNDLGLIRTIYDEQGRAIKKEDNRLEILKEILIQSDKPDSRITNLLNTTGLSDTDLFSFLRFAAFKGKLAFLKGINFVNLPPAIGRQIMIDLLNPPFELLKGDATDFKSLGYLKEIAPLITILDKESDQITAKEISDFKQFIKNNPKLKDHFEPIIKKIETESNDQVKKGLISWCAYAAAVFNDLDTTQVKAIIDADVLTRILEYRDPIHRYTFTRGLSQTVQSPTGLKDFNPNWKKGNSTLLLATLTNFGASPQVVNELRTQIDNTRSLKDRKVSSALAQLLFLVNANGPYKTDEAHSIAQYIINILNKKPSTKHLESDSKVAQEEEEDKKASVERTKKSHQMEKRSADALKICTDLAAMANVYQIFGKEECVRLIKMGSDLSSLFILRLNELFNVSNTEYLELRYQETFGKYRDPGALFTYLRAVNSLSDPDKTAVKATLNTYVNIVLDGNFENVKNDSVDNPHLQQIYSSDSKIKQLWCKPLAEKQLSLGINEAEVKASEENAKPRYRVVETIDPCDLLLIGTEVQSCQKIDGNPEHNKALVSYLINGEIRVIAVKAGNKIIARAVIRLMWDEKKQRPVLLQERVYSNIEDPDIAIAINDMAKEKAKMMGLCLVSKIISTDVPYDGKVTFSKGRAPFIYSDAAGGVQSEPFSIENCFVLYEP